MENEDQFEGVELLNDIRGTPLPAYSLTSHKGGNRLSDYKSAGIPSTFPTELEGSI